MGDPYRHYTKEPAVPDSIPTRFENITAIAKANVYFDGGVVSHTILFADGSKKTLGLIFPGSYHFGTDAPEKMEITAGACRVRLDGSKEWADYAESETFNVPGKSGFDIEVSEGVAQYICSFL